MVPDVWGVVATANAPLLDVARFCAHHLYEGAEVIFIYLDDPDVEVNAALETLPQIKVIPTDNAYWSSKGARPENIEQRQSRNARDAARKMKAQFPHLKWLGHLDMMNLSRWHPQSKWGAVLQYNLRIAGACGFCLWKISFQTNIVTLVLSDSNFSNAESQNGVEYRKLFSLNLVKFFQVDFSAIRREKFFPAVRR